ncbi:DUF6489 family protein [Marinibaculum pumilum]|uniref:DUF6489 family protein n=1 Tax=Marinibaculum pumilum TaxID=1766165 RepID=A0ABV7KVI4_9PROT
MKIHVDVDCTPEEARTFFGLPDVQPMQEALMSQIQERMQMALAQTDPDVLMKTWLPVGMAGFEQLQKMFWSNLSGGGRSRDGERS